ncbi:MAG: leucine-rich repeat domain-containing protein [Lachnospiraceae bacterium]|nr:leucine-rich repeat domain-containing protein [Lachnospiraceae bacterium]
MKGTMRLIRWLFEFVNGWVLAAVIVVILLIAFVVLVDKKSKVRRPGTYRVKTPNGAILICHCFDRENYQLVGIERQRRSIIIPRTVDGVHEITRLGLNDYTRKTYKKVRHIHLPVSMKDVNEKAMGESYHINAFLLFPNLKTITVEEGNPKFRAEGSMLYQGNSKLTAVAPGHFGTVFIGKDVTKIAASALLDLKIATAFEVEKDNPKYQSINGVLYSKNGKKLLRYPIRKIGPKFTIPEGVKKIQAEAFFGQRYLQRIEMPESLRKIGYSAFSGCRLLRQVILNEKLRILEPEAFRATKIRELTLPEGLREAEIGSIPVKGLIIPENLGEVSLYETEEGNNLLIANSLIIENPALDLEALENEEGKDSVFTCKKIYAYEGSLPYRQIDKVKDTYIIDLYALPGKKYDEPPQHIGPTDTRWYSEDKDEFYISTPAELAGLSVLSEEEWRLQEDDIVFHLTADIDMSQYPNFKPISAMEGIFDGEGHTISNLHIYRPTENNVGLFRRIDWGTIKNLHVQGEVTGGNCTGGIVGDWGYFGTLKNCSFDGKVEGYGYTGQKFGHRWK